MKGKYQEIMDHIEVTDEMRERILNNVRQMDLERQPDNVTPFPEKRSKSRSLRRWLSLAACLAVVLTGALTLPSVLTPSETPGTDPGGDVQTVPDFVTCESAEALSAAVGFQVLEPENLPFSVSEVEYTAISGELAQAEYRGSGGEDALFRQSRGTEDNSGDYNDYPDIASLEGTSLTGELRGADGVYTLAVWNDGEFSCSLSLSEGLSLEEWVGLLVRYGG